MMGACLLTIAPALRKTCAHYTPKRTQLTHGLGQYGLACKAARLDGGGRPVWQFLIMCEIWRLPRLQCGAGPEEPVPRAAGLAGFGGEARRKRRRLPLEKVFSVEAVPQDRLRPNRHPDGVERALGGAQQVRFDVGVFLCHRNDRVALG